MSTTVKNSKMARRYGEEFKRQAVELLIHSGKSQRQVAKELDVSEYSLTLWKKAYLGRQAPAEVSGEMNKIIRELHREMSITVKNSKMARRYWEELKRRAVELLLHSGRTQRQVAPELDVSDYSLTLWKKAYLGQQQPAEIEGQMKSPEEMAKIIRKQHTEIEYLKRQREILSLVQSSAELRDLVSCSP